MRSVTASYPKERADIEDNFRKTIGQALGGIAVLIGAGTAYYGTQQTLRGNKDLLISNQVAKGFERLSQREPITFIMSSFITSDEVVLCKVARSPGRPRKEQPRVVMIRGRQRQPSDKLNQLFGR